MRKLFLTSMAVVAMVGASQVQARTITGTVLEAGTNEPCIGATVMPIGGGQGAATDIDGKFTINVPDNVKTAKVSYVGYKEKVVTLSPGMRVELASTTSNLDEVVVVAYGTATKESLTGSVSVVGSKEIEDRPVTSVTQALEGNAPGVQVNSTTSAPGSAPSIRIRGFGTFTGNASPMYVVDGVPFDGSMADLNPADIESMTVLKDAASCALYGVRGSNGVILITTKHAKTTGHAEVTLQIREGMYTRGLPQYDTLNARDWMETMFSAKANSLVSSQPGAYPDLATANAYLQENFISGYLQGQNIFGAYDAEAGGYRRAAANETYDANGKILPGLDVLPGYVGTLDWWNPVHRTGLRQEYNLNLAAASDKYNLFASVGYLNEKGYLLKTDFERFNGRFNVNFQPTTYFKAGVNLAASYQTQQANTNAGTSTMVNPFTTQFYSPIYSYYEHDPETGALIYDENGNPAWNMNGRNDRRNVAFELRKDFTEYNYLLVDANAYATAVIPYGFELTVRGNMSRSTTHGNKYQNKFLGNAYPVGRLNTDFSQYRYHTLLEQLTWAHRYGAEQQHSVDVLFAHENTKTYSSSDGISMSNQVEDDYYAASNFTDITQNPSGAYAEARAESYLGRLRYSYDDRYFVEGSIRRDGSDRFSSSNRWGTFWSVGGSWIISKEKFLQPVTWIDYLKFRVAYGSVGNYLSAPANSWQSQYAYISWMSNTSMLLRASLGNPDLTWEAQKTFDIGLEGSLFNNRLNFTVGYFDKTSSNLIFDLTGAASTGWSMGGSPMTTPINLGKLANRGWELSFNGTILRNKDVEWTASIDATFLKNKVLSLPYDNRDMNNGGQRLSVGHSIYEWYTGTFVGVDQMTGQAIYEFDENQFKYDRGAVAGYTEEQLDQLWKNNIADAKSANALIDINGKTYTTQSLFATRSWHGTAIPTVYGSFGTQVSWKGINLGVLFTYSLGGKTMDSSYQSLMSVESDMSAYHKDVLKAWNGVPAGMTADSPNRIDPNGIPQNNGDLNKDNNATSSRFLTSASWLVFKNINLSYDLPKAWAHAVQMQNINLGFSADNLFTVASRKGLNPQQTYSGVQTGTSDGTFVTSRVFSFQLTCRF